MEYNLVLKLFNGSYFGYRIPKRKSKTNIYKIFLLHLLTKN